MRPVAVLFGVLSVCRAQAQCDWLPGEGHRGIDDEVFALTTWDPDGPGPQPALLVAGGRFTVAGDALANTIATWDGQRWQALGPGFGAPVTDTVTALAVVQLHLHAAVVHLNPSTGALASEVDGWDGQAWHPIAAGIPGTVAAMAEFGGDLIAGGSFTTIGGVAANGVARWDGSAWTPLDTGVDGTYPGDPGIGPRVSALLTQGPDLYVGGTFLNAGGQAAGSVARWDGAWHTLGAGLQPYYPGSTADVDSFTVFQGRLIAGGLFGVGAATEVHAASWDGATWTAMDPGHGPGSGSALAAFDDQLILGGTAKGSGLFGWTGQAWQPFAGGTDDSVQALTLFRGDLICAGWFSKAGPRALSRIARWDGAAWHGLPETGYASSNGPGILLAAHAFQNDLVIGGYFYGVGDVDASTIARWDGDSWHPMTGGQYPTGLPHSAATHSFADFNASLAVADYAGVQRVFTWDGQGWAQQPVFPPLMNWGALVGAMVEHHEQLYAGGSFGDPVNGNLNGSHVLRLDSSAWAQLPDDLNDYVLALLSYRGDLIAAGPFTSTLNEGLPVRGVARWDGRQWSGFGAGVNGTPEALAQFRGDLIITGSFTTGGTAPAINIARWDGTAWRPLGSGLVGPYSTTGHALAVFDDTLIVGGWFTQVGGVAAQNIAAWDGQSWHDLNGGIDGQVLALTVQNNQLVAVGSFNTAGGRVSINLARWACVAPCYANCDGSVAPPYLNVADFVCFLSRFAAGDPYANCDGSTTPPTLNVADFVCFSAAFARGCP
jgi:hypothetical protein